MAAISEGFGGLERWCRFSNSALHYSSPFSAARFEVFACTIHHGPGPTEAWRTQAQELGKQISQNLGVTWVTNEPCINELKWKKDAARLFRYDSENFEKNISVILFLRLIIPMICWKHVF